MSKEPNLAMLSILFGIILTIMALSVGAWSINSVYGKVSNNVHFEIFDCTVQGNSTHEISGPCPEVGAESPEINVDKSPETKSPETKSPETKSPETKSPETKSPETKSPETKSPETKSPETKSPETKSPETKSPETKSPETKSPETKSPETKSPETKSPETKSPETKSPETKSPETKSPETKSPETKSPETKSPETKSPETKSPETKSPDINVDNTPETKVDTNPNNYLAEPKIMEDNFNKYDFNEIHLSEPEVEVDEDRETKELVPALPDTSTSIDPFGPSG